MLFLLYFPLEQKEKLQQQKYKNIKWKVTSKLTENIYHIQLKVPKGSLGLLINGIFPQILHAIIYQVSVTVR